MDMHGGYMMRPRERGPMMRPGFPPLRGRGPMLDRLRVLPPRPALMRGPPPAFVGRPVALPPGRPRIMGPVMLPRPPMPPPGALGPPGSRSMLPPPRPLLGPPPPRPLPPEMVDGYMSNVLLNKDGNSMPNKMNQNVDNSDSHGGTRDMRNNRIVRNNQTVMQQGGPGLKKSRKENKNRRMPPPPLAQASQIPQVPLQTPVQSQHQAVQNMHPGMHQMSQGPAPSLPPQQNSMHIKQPPAQKPVPPMQSQFIPTQSAPGSHQNPIRGGMPPRNRGGAHVGNRGNVPMNYQPNVPNQMPPRPNTMMNGPPAGPQPVVQYSNAPPPSYPVPPPQVPMKRAAPPPVNPPHQPVMPPPKRVRYEAPAPSNGYPTPSYQQLPPQQQSSYSMNYEIPPPTSAPLQQPTDMYGNMTTPTTTSMLPVQNYSSADYGNYQMAPPTAPTYTGNGNTQYANSGYPSNQPYSNSYSSGSYDTGTDYSSAPAQSMPTADPYAGYSKPVSTVDSYSYNNTSYNTQQTGYDDYSTGYTDNSGYTQTVPAVNGEKKAA